MINGDYHLLTFYVPVVSKRTDFLETFICTDIYSNFQDLVPKGAQMEGRIFDCQ